ncbi:hypothetical protein MUB24_14685 [Lederbergia sp. NSJ-179]|uniref:hypothetical protein n=1 Tax=Lederbergia sp. NSJ-179 TaxID=2931402 RepID=UPI001FD4408C|nr:hypothetical protein [Lederbergia sp. NSJ-179]MCJ7842126.1 hypothetical protein [Lederbergia sp. NSJ-179]
MKKIFFNLVLLFIISALIIGCSSESSGDNSSSKETKGSEEGPAVELVYVSTQNEESMKQVIKAFEEKNPNIKIKYCVID